MSGNLFHGRDFENEAYRGADGNQHTELIPVDGDFFSITNNTWDSIVSQCEKYGIAPDNWPVYKNAIDIPLDDVRQKNILLRNGVLALPNEIAQSSEWLQRIVVCISQGEIIAYCQM